MLSRPAPQSKGKFTRGKTLSSGIDDLWQMDLADLSDIMSENDRHRYMLTVTDVFSRWAWAEPVLITVGGSVAAPIW